MSYKRLSKVLMFFSVLLVYSCNSAVGSGSNQNLEVVDIDRTQLAFPDAEGYGAYSKGGRGGRVIYVTNLNDSGSGSFREAVEADGPRTIIFAVSGIIELETDIDIGNPFITIAGQSAPDDGITLKNCGLDIETNDVIIRHIRVRPGDSSAGSPYGNRDSISIGANAYNIMIDHVSASWAIDEVISTFYTVESSARPPQFVTIQNSIISEGLHDSHHPKGAHSKALLIGDNSMFISVYRNVFAHNDDRTPVQVKGGANCDVINNVVYNWGTYSFSFAFNYSLRPLYVNMTENHFKSGPDSTGDFISINGNNYYNSKVYLEGNSSDDGDAGTTTLLESFNSDNSSFYSSYSFLSDTAILWTSLSDPVVDWNPTISLLDISSNQTTILNNAGAILPQRDSVDTRIINDVINRTGSIVDSVTEAGGYPNFTDTILTTTEIDAIDSDRDGMSDSWESSNGLDSSDPSDRNGDLDGDGYTNLEEYLNSL